MPASSRRRSAFAHAARSRGQVAGKNTSAAVTMMSGNMPIGNNIDVTAWNASTTRYATTRVRRIESQSAIVRSNRQPAQLITIAAPGTARSDPSTGRPVRDASHTLSGCPWSSQSAFTFARPANV